MRAALGPQRFSAAGPARLKPRRPWPGESTTKPTSTSARQPPAPGRCCAPPWASCHLAVL
eukprot:5247575-Pyramimonas_sp.AAC.1